QQIECEKQRDEAKQRVMRHDHITNDIKRVQIQQAKYQQDQTKLQSRIAQIEPLEPLANLLQERGDTLTQLRIQMNERNNIARQLQEKRAALQEKLPERDQTAKDFQRAKRNVDLIDEHREEAEKMPGLQEQYSQLVLQKNRLEGNIEGYVTARAQSAGGQCPLLHESCLNIRRHGIASLESYFDGFMSEEHAQISGIVKQQEKLQADMNQIKKFYEALNKYERYIEQRDMFASQLQRVTREIERLERDNATLSAELDELQHIEQRVGEAENAYQESRAAGDKM